MRRRALLHNDIEYVDLGLPSGTLWAKGNITKDNDGNYNIGNETDDGCYFQWGVISGHNADEGYDFSETNYNATSSRSLTKSFIPGDVEYDAARAQLGFPCKIATTAQWQELIDNCTWTYSSSPQKHYTVTGYNGKSITFYYSGAIIGTTKSSSSACFWTNSRLSSDNNYGLQMYLQSGQTQDRTAIGKKKWNGYSIRPIKVRTYQTITITLNPIDNTSASGISLNITDSETTTHSGITNGNGQVIFTNVAYGDATLSALDSRYMVATKTITISNIDKSFTIDCRYAPIGVYIDTTDYSLISAEDWSTQGVGKTANGVAVITETHAFVIHLTSETHTKIYSPNTTPCSGITAYGETSARSYLNGIGDTYLMAASYGSGTTYAAGYAISAVFPNGKHGYMGSVGELVLVKDNKTDIDSCLSACNGVTWKNDHYWSSTYRGKSSSNTYTFWEYRVRDDSLVYNTTSGDHYVRPFCKLI